MAPGAVDIVHRGRWHGQDYKTVASPIIDVIKMDTFEYLFSTPNLRGVFTWSLQFQWEPSPEKGLRAEENIKCVWRGFTPTHTHTYTHTH